MRKWWKWAALVLAVCAGLCWLRAGVHWWKQQQWLREHRGAYDSYLLGWDASPQVLEQLGGYLGGGVGCLPADGTIADQHRMASQLLEQEAFSRLIWCLHLEDGAFVEDRRLRDAEKVGDPQVYRQQFGREFEKTGTLAHVAEAVADIRDLCAEKHVELTVLLSPVHIRRWEGYRQEDLHHWMATLAAEVDFWDFSLTPVSLEDRYFYNGFQARTCVEQMVLAELFEDDRFWRPESFGTRVTEATCESHLESLFTGDLEPVETSGHVPILLYHHLADPAVVEDTTITPEAFAHQMDLLVEAGFTAVTIQDLLDFVHHGGSLPEKPVLITFDDGYQSNYDYAWPILAQRGLKGTIFTIGVSIGKSLYKDTDHAMTPHFGLAEAGEMLASGVMDLQSHTWDMHQWPPFETGEQIRSSVLPFPQESEADYTAALRGDWEHYSEHMEQELGHRMTALAYPGGEYAELTEVLLHELGVPVTMSTRNDSQNILLRGLPQSLYALCRWNISANDSDELFLEILEGTGIG